MNATTIFNAVNSAQKTAAIAFATVLGLGLFTAFATAISALLALLIPVLVAATKAAIFGYPLFVAGLIAINIKEQCQKKEAPTTAMLPPCQPIQPTAQTQLIGTKVLVLPPAKTLNEYYLHPQTLNWQQQILKEIRQIDTCALPTSNQQQEQRKPKPLNNQLATVTVGWQAINQVAILLEAIKASELKSFASALGIPKYRKMNKTQLLVEIVAAYDNAPAFSR